MKKLETKNIITLGITVFVLYLCIHYWSTVSGLLGTVFAAYAASDRGYHRLFAEYPDEFL